MASYQKSFYLFKISFLGYRYYGWQKQSSSDYKTVQQTIEDKMSLYFNEELGKPFNFTTTSSSRTDAKVSALEFYFKLKIKEEKKIDLDCKQFQTYLNSKLPSDIKILEVLSLDHDKQIIGQAYKEYNYCFYFGEQKNIFLTPYMTYLSGDLDIERMKQAAKLFEGEHHFQNYTYKYNDLKKSCRTIDSCQIVPYLEANIPYPISPPKNAYCMIVKGQGFARYQIRFMIGALSKIGKHDVSIEQLEDSLKEGSTTKAAGLVPASGLLLRSINLQ